MITEAVPLLLPKFTIGLLGDQADAKKVCYALFTGNNDDCLYVGSTVRPAILRLREHARKKPWFGDAKTVYIKAFTTIDEMLETEVIWHHQLGPKYALTHKLQEYCWKWEWERLGDAAPRRVMCSCGWQRCEHEVWIGNTCQACSDESRERWANMPRPEAMAR